MQLVLPALGGPWEPPAAPSHSTPLRLHLNPPPRRAIGGVKAASPSAEQSAASPPSDQPSSGHERRPRRFTFAERCQQLAGFQEQHGHTRVPVQEPTGLGTWVAAKRHAWKAGQLPPSQQQQLAALGFCADAFDEAWAARFRQLSAFHSEHGHCRVPPPAAPAAAASRAGQQQPVRSRLAAAQAQEKYPGLHAWLQQQRHRWRQGTLPDDRRRRLEGLGVHFHAPHEVSWDARFAELLAFKEEHGHANVPARWPPNPTLAAWVEAQRRRWRGTQGAPLTASQHSRLISCGFRFELQQRGDEAWEGKYAQVVQLQQQRGGSLGDQLLPAAGGLRQWAHGQRQLWRQGVLPPERASRLAALGLLRGAHERWLERLAELDALVACLGLPAVHALLLLAPSPSAAAAMAEAAIGQAAHEGSSGEERESGGGWHAGSGRGTGARSSSGGGPTAGALEDSPGARLEPHEAAAAVRWWFRHLHASLVPAKTAQALHSRGLGCLLPPEYCRV